MTPKGFKDGAVTPEVIEAWFQRWPDANVGVVTGQESGLIVLDTDPKNGGFESFAALEAQYGTLPTTLVVETGSGGTHHYFRHPDDGRKLPNCANLAGFMGIDVRGDGGYVVAPPSLHATGVHYAFREESAEVADAPAWLLDLIVKKPFKEQGARSFAVPVAAGASVEIIREGGRNERLTKEAGALRRRGHDEALIAEVLLQMNERICSPPLDEDEVRRIAASICRYAPDESAAPLNDSGNAERLVRHLDGKARFCPDAKGWFNWNGRHWEPDTGSSVLAATKDVARLIGVEAELVDDEEKRKAMQAHCKKSQSLKFREAMEKLARVEPQVQVRRAAFDDDRWVLTVGNGVLDLRTGELLAFDKDRLCLKATDVSFNLAVPRPRWEAFLDRVFGGNREVIRYVQKAVGYSLTGSTKEQCFFLLHGWGKNGKSTFLSVLHELLGTYALQASFSTFLAKEKNSGGATPELARLAGARLVAASEGAGGRAFDEAVIKSLTGDDPITCRELYQSEFTYRPAFKIWLATCAFRSIVITGIGTS